MADCKICGTPTLCDAPRIARSGRHAVDYHMCPECEYCCTDEPYWLDEAYSRAIDATDTGLVQRNLMWARWLKVMLPRLFPQGPYVDWAGGCGMMVRLMRDAGFEFYWQDLYADNLLSPRIRTQSQRQRTSPAPRRGPNRGHGTIEVLEHTPDPLGFFKEVLKETGARAIYLLRSLCTLVRPLIPELVVLRS